MYRQYGDRVSFLTIYIKEAHPIDEWRVEANNKDRDDLCYRQPPNMAQRVLIANDFVKRFDYDVPILIAAMANRADSLYAGSPERCYIVDQSNTIVYAGAAGPLGYHP